MAILPLVDGVEFKRTVGKVVGVRDVRQRLELLQHEDGLLVAPVGLSRRLAAEFVVDVEIGPSAMREHQALNVELRGPGKGPLVLRIAVGNVRATFLELLEEGRDFEDVLPRRVGRKFQATTYSASNSFVCFSNRS